MIKYKLHGLTRQMPLAHKSANDRIISISIGKTFVLPNVSESGV